MVWEKLIDLSENIRSLFNDNFTEYPITEDVSFDGWCDTYWKSEHVRKCHLKTIDNRNTQKLWLMHVNIFPVENLNIPILGFDLVAGQNKITGAFFDFSPVDVDHHYMEYFREKVSELSWEKARNLPEWADIFSQDIIAAGNIKTDTEIEQLVTTCFDLTKYYVENIANNNKQGSFLPQQNYYCKQQKLNPHLHRSILSMGISEEDKNRYVNNVLFEEI